MNEYHPIWQTAIGTAAGYVVILTVLALLVFGLPYIVFILV